MTLTSIQWPTSQTDSRVNKIKLLKSVHSISDKSDKRTCQARWYFFFSNTVFFVQFVHLKFFAYAVYADNESNFMK